MPRHWQNIIFVKRFVKLSVVPGTFLARDAAAAPAELCVYLQDDEPAFAAIK
jgi:hypothetical protein